MVNTAMVFRDVVGKPFNADRNAAIRLNVMMRTEGHREAVLPIRRLNATQDAVNADYRNAWNRYAVDDPFRLPAVVRYRGLFYVTDGHHRIMARAADGHQDTPVRLFDLDGAEDYVPLLDLILIPELAS